MKIALISCGPEGDIRPFQALAMRLVTAGHTVRVCSHDIFAERFQQLNIDYVSLGPPFDKAYYNETFDKMLAMNDSVETLTFLAKRGVLASAHEWFEDAQKAIQGWDLAIIHQFDIPGQEAATRQQVPWVTVCLCPGEIQTSYEPPVPFPNISRLTNKLFWRYVNYQYRNYDALFNEFLTSIGAKNRKNIALESTYSSDLTLIAASPALCTEYDDRPEYFKFTGNWHVRTEGYEPSEDLYNFLNGGEPPIIVSFSSVGGSFGRELAEILLGALQKLGVRAIIQKGWLNLDTVTPHDHIFFTSFVPHDYLFQHAALVIHHGGAGTSQAACRAGVPSLVIPFLADEFYWGTLLHSRGISPKMIPQKELKAEILIERIEEILHDPSFKEHAQAMKLKMNHENGLDKAVLYIEEYAKQKLSCATF